MSGWMDGRMALTLTLILSNPQAMTESPRSTDTLLQWLVETAVGTHTHAHTHAHAHAHKHTHTHAHANTHT